MAPYMYVLKSAALEWGKRGRKDSIKLKKKKSSKKSYFEIPGFLNLSRE
jgi:hypothetical protein